jgi:hypothetical protein
VARNCHFLLRTPPSLVWPLLGETRDELARCCGCGAVGGLHLVMPPLALGACHRSVLAYHRDSRYWGDA